MACATPARVNGLDQSVGDTAIRTAACGFVWGEPARTD